MKKIVRVLLVCLVTCFSFYYTDKVISFTKDKDPIMMKIKKAKEESHIAYVNGTLSHDSMLVGSSGLMVDVDASYEKMKKLDTYNSSLLEYISISPDIKKSDNLDRLILGKKTNEKEISFVFSLEDIDLIDEIVYILNHNDVSSTFFIDGSFIEKNIIYFRNNFKSNLSLGYYGYKGNYSDASLLYTKGLFKRNITNVSKYCLYKDDSFLNACISARYNTIKPIEVDKNLYNTIKNSKQNGYIYLIKANKYNIKELNTTLKFLKQKGYNILSIDNLLKE